MRKGSETEEVVKLSYFAEIGKAITSAANLTDMMRAIMNKIGEIFAPSYWSLLLRDLKTGELKFSMVVGSGVEGLKGMRLPRGKGIAGWIAEQGEPLIIQDVRRDARFDQSADDLTNFTTKSIIGVPLKTQKNVFGVIELINTLDNTSFNAYDLKVLATIGDFAAIAIEKVYYLAAFRKIATVDPLTGVYNRRAFTTFFERELEKQRRYDTVMSMMMVDVDDFKEINDRYGHTVGDEVLVAVAKTLAQNTRKLDFVCRFGGDEFVVLMPETKSEEARVIKERIVAQLGDRYAGTEIAVSVSIGIKDSTEEDLTGLLASVDREMYRDKAIKSEQSLSDLGSNIEDFLEEESLESYR